MLPPLEAIYNRLEQAMPTTTLSQANQRGGG
jgi:hypothetical protein